MAVITEIYNPVQKTGAKIIYVTRSTLFYFISSRIALTFVVIIAECIDKSRGTLEPFVD